MRRNGRKKRRSAETTEIPNASHWDEYLEESQQDDDDFHFVELDPNRLDEEWVNQPSMYFQYAEKLADARKDLETAKIELEIVRAEMDLEIRRDPESHGLLKITEESVKSAITLTDRYQVAQQAVYGLKHRVDIIAGAVVALDHRKKALEKLVELRLADYFSEPRAPKEAKERMENLEKRAARTAGKKRKRRIGT